MAEWVISLSKSLFPYTSMRWAWFLKMKTSNGTRFLDGERTMTLGLNFPVSDYYRDHIEEDTTLSRGGRWWSAALLITNPKNSQPFINLYMWENVRGQWKTRKSFSIRSKDALRRVAEALATLGKTLP